MPGVTISMTSANAARVNAAIQGLFPIPQIPDPEYVGDPPIPTVDEYTALEWAKMFIIKGLARTTRRWEDKQAKDAVSIPEDPSIAT